MTDSSFADRIRARYPEGLTGVFAIGGTRTTYILEQNRDKADPGKIEDFAAHGEYLLKRYWDLIDLFFDLGGQNMLVSAFSFRGFYNRGEEYARLVAREMLRFITPESIAMYRDKQIDPYFTGIDTLLLLPEADPNHQVGRRFAAFQRDWQYTEGYRKLIWDIAPIPLYSFWQIYKTMTGDERQALEDAAANLDNLEEINRVYYRHFSRKAFGTDLPMPHLYIGTNKGGDLKWRSPLPLALAYGEYMRMFFTPYPTLFINRATLRRILEDLAFRDRFHSASTDYAGRYTPQLVQAEYERVMRLADDPENVLGLVRNVDALEED